MKVEEYIREFEQLYIKCALREEPEQTIARLNWATLERVKFHPFWTFEDACKLAVKVEKQLKSRRTYSSAAPKPTTLVRTFSSFKPDPHPKNDKDKGKGKEVAKEVPKGQKTCFKCHGYGYFQADCPNRRVLTIREIEGLDHMEVKEDKQGTADEGEISYLPLEEGEMLMIKGVLHATEALQETNQREQIFHSRCKAVDKTCDMEVAVQM